MADISVIIDVLGAEDMEKAARVTQTLQNKIQSLGKQLQKGNITNSQYQKGVQQLIKKNAVAAGGYKALQSQVQKYAFSLQRQINETKKAAVAQNLIQSELTQTTVATSNAATEAKRLANAQRMSGKSTNKFGMVAQQVGYQVGDFFVQVQSGTNAMMAFGQQGTQLAGLMPGLSGAIVGIGLSAFTMLAGGIMRAREEAEEVEDALDSLSSAISAMESSFEAQQLSLVELTETYGDLALTIRDTKQAMAEAAALKAFISIQEDATLTTGVLDRLRTATENLSLAQEGAFEELPNALRAAQDPLQFAETILRNIGNELGISEEKAAQLGKALSDFKNAENFRQQALAAGDIVKLLDQVPDSIKKGNVPLLTMIERMGKLSESTAQLSKEAPSSDWMNSAIEGVNSLISRVLDAIRGVRTLKDESKAAAMWGEGSGLVFDEVSGRYVTPDKHGIENLHTNLGLSLGEAVPGTGLMGTSGGGGGGGMSAAEKLKKDFENLKRSIDEAYQAQQKFDEGKAILDQQVALGNIDQAEYNRLLGLLSEKYKQAEAAGETFADHMKKIGETAKQAFGDAFTSIVDGTKSAKDAFKDMARAILKQAFDLLVVKPLMDALFGNNSGGSIGGLVGKIFGVTQANGGAWDKGVQMFANGGVVSSATAFQHSGGLGVMGEAGPEAIMPLKRGKNGKLGVQLEGGSEQSVVINQSFNFSANGDDSVKRIIAQEAPKIADLTQRQVLEARARGGAFRNTFGG